MSELPALRDKQARCFTISPIADFPEDTPIMRDRGMISSGDPMSMDRVGRLIGAGISTEPLKSYINSLWDQSFSECCCPICDVQPGTPDPSSPSGCVDSLLQSDPPMPTCIKSLPRPVGSFHMITGQAVNAHCSARMGSKNQLAWVRRALTRTIGENDNHSSGFVMDLPDGTNVEFHFPFEFHALRHALGIDDTRFGNSLSNIRPVRPKGGKSSARFAVTGDGLFILKSVNDKEAMLFQKMGPGFFWYYCRAMFQGMPSLILPLFGMFSVKTSERKAPKRSYIVMRNLTTPDCQLLCDLKGAGVRRVLRPSPDVDSVLSDVSDEADLCASVGDFVAVSESEKERLVEDHKQLSPTSGLQVLWDQDFRMWRGGDPLPVDPNSLSFLNAAVSNDTEFLSALEIVDYSLLLCIDQPSLHGQGTMTGGIIDFLRPYTWDKRLESVMKTVNNNLSQIGSIISKTEPSDASLDMARAPTVINPEPYAKRFRTNILSSFCETQASGEVELKDGSFSRVGI